MGFLLYEELEEEALGEATRAEIDFTVKRIGPPLPPKIEEKYILPIALGATALVLVGVAVAASRKKSA